MNMIIIFCYRCVSWSVWGPRWRQGPTAEAEEDENRLRCSETEPVAKTWPLYRNTGIRTRRETSWPTRSKLHSIQRAAPLLSL